MRDEGLADHISLSYASYLWRADRLVGRRQSTKSSKKIVDYRTNVGVPTAVDRIDRKISELVQANGRCSSAEIAKAVGVSISTAHERLRRLSASGAITAWRAVLDPRQYGAGLCGFVLIDVSYDGEEKARQAISRLPEVQEMHHISGPHSYLLKVRVTDTTAMQSFLQEHLKPLKGVTRTETIFVLETVKETTKVLIGAGNDKEVDS